MHMRVTHLFLIELAVLLRHVRPNVQACTGATTGGKRAALPGKTGTRARCRLAAIPHSSSLFQHSLSIAAVSTTPALACTASSPSWNANPVVSGAGIVLLVFDIKHYLRWERSFWDGKFGTRLTSQVESTCPVQEQIVVYARREGLAMAGVYA